MRDNNDNRARHASSKQQQSLDSNNACKVFVNRIPPAFTEESLVRLVESVTGQQDLITEVGLAYEESAEDASDDKARSKETTKKQHKGFAFMQMKTAELATLLIQKQTLKGGAKPSSKKKHTLYLSAVTDDRNEANFICFLWQQLRCPYGDDCKFRHTGEGACIPSLPTNDDSSRKIKCWEFMKKGSCKQGEKCLFLHPEKTCIEAADKKRSDSEKDCINWKTKGKCRKRDTCPYRHDDAVRDNLLAKKKKRQMTEADSKSTLPNSKKLKQPLSIRVFGLNYETTVADVRVFFGSCGTIQDITFPSFEDSGRSKGYCEVLFSSPKAVEKAILLHETELHGRWLSIQPGKMLEQQWQRRSAS